MKGIGDSIFRFFIVIIVASIVASFLAGYVTAKDFDAQASKIECEKNIPRDKSCKLIAVPNGD